MAGRKRRASTSSVETVDDTQIRWRHETSVVRSVPKDLSSDDWPVFELRDAIILNQDGQTIANALHAGHKGPFIVRGNLMIDDAAQRTNCMSLMLPSWPEPHHRLPSLTFSSNYARTNTLTAGNSTVCVLLYWRSRRWQTVDMGFRPRRLVRNRSVRRLQTHVQQDVRSDHHVLQHG